MLKVAVVGASGYTGVELLRILHGHPRWRSLRYLGEKRGKTVPKYFRRSVIAILRSWSIWSRYGFGKADFISLPSASGCHGGCSNLFEAGEKGR